MSLDGKIAIVTGGARGIGAGIVRSLSKQGAKVSTQAPSLLYLLELVLNAIGRFQLCLSLVQNCCRQPCRRTPPQQ